MAAPAPRRAPQATVVDRVQALIEELYDVATPLQVRDYLVDEAVRRRLPGAQLHLPEQLFVGGACGPTPGDDAAPSNADEAVEVALYIDADVLAVLGQDDPFVRLHPDNLEPFCVLAEGVSHFVFLAWRLGAGLDVSALELELQAEVDKFCACLLLLHARPHPALTPHALWRQLFVRYELQPGLSADEASRYHAASRAAGRAARTLLGGPQEVRPAAVLRGARSFCRRSLAEKLRPSTSLGRDA